MAFNDLPSVSLLLIRQIFFFFQNFVGPSKYFSWIKKLKFYFYLVKVQAGEGGEKEDGINLKGAILISHLSLVFTLFSEEWSMRFIEVEKIEQSIGSILITFISSVMFEKYFGTWVRWGEKQFNSVKLSTKKFGIACEWDWPQSPLLHINLNSYNTY